MIGPAEWVVGWLVVWPCAALASILRLFGDRAVVPAALAAGAAVEAARWVDGLTLRRIPR